MRVDSVSYGPLQGVVLARVGSVCSRVTYVVRRVPSRISRVRRPVASSAPPETPRILLYSLNIPFTLLHNFLYFRIVIYRQLFTLLYAMFFVLSFTWSFCSNGSSERQQSIRSPYRHLEEKKTLQIIFNFNLLFIVSNSLCLFPLLIKFYSGIY